MRTPLLRLACAALAIDALSAGGLAAQCSQAGVMTMRTVCETSDPSSGKCATAVEAVKTACKGAPATNSASSSDPAPVSDANGGESPIDITGSVLTQVANLETHYRVPGGPLAGVKNPTDGSTAISNAAKLLNGGSNSDHGTASDSHEHQTAAPNAPTQKAQAAESHLPEQAPPKQVNDVARQYLDSANPQDAQRLIGRVLKSDPTNSDALGMRAQVKLTAGDSKGALDDARAALKSDPNNAFARMLIGHSDELSAAGSRIPKKLATGWNTAADDSIGDARAQRGAAMGASAGARSAGYSDHAVGLPASNLDSAVVVGWSKFRIGDMNGAADAASAALQKIPGDAQALGLRAAAYNRSGKPLLALADAEAALKAKPKDVVALLEKGYAQYQLGRYQDALSSVESALEVDPLNAMGHLYRGMILEKLNRVQDAVASYLKAAELDPSLKPLSDESVARLGGAANAAGPMSARRSPVKFAIWGIALLIALGFLIKGALRAIKPDWATPVTPLR